MHLWAHFCTITKHRHLVIANCFRAGIPGRGLLHDLSKYSPTEFFVSARYYQGDRSPNAAARDALGYSAAWIHHKGRNSHHYEYWTDLAPGTLTYVPVPMPPKALAEMLCDRVAASKVYKGKAYTDSSPLEYWQGEKGSIAIHPDTAAQLDRFLQLLAEQGERAYFAAIRRFLAGK